MLVKPLPKDWLIHDMIYTEKSEEDDGWGNTTDPDPVVISHIRYDDSTVFSRDNMQTKIVAEGVIFVDAVNSEPVVDFKEESKVTILLNGSTIKKDLTIKKIIPCYYPTKKAVHHYEIEVI